MKNLLYTFAILVGGFAYAQDSGNQIDYMETTKVKTESLENDGETVKTKVKVVTRKEQEVKTDPSQDNMYNADQIIAPTKVTKTIMVDSDRDASYETKNTITYYTYNNVKYAFKTNKNGFIVSTMNGNQEIAFGNARKASKKDLYIFNTTNYSGIGYFENNYFVVDYYNNEENILMTQRFEQNKF